MTLEEDLRMTLRDEAGKPLMQPDLLARVRVGVRADKRRRTAMLGAAALLIAIVTVPVVVLAQRPPASVLNPAPPAPSAPVTEAPSDAAPSPSAALTSPIVWARPRLAMPTFPLTPDWLPDGLGPRRIDLRGSNVVLAYDDDRGDRLAVEVGPVVGDWGDVEGDEDHRSTVGTASATVRTAGSFDGARPGDRYVGVRWRLADGQWATAISFGPRKEAEVLRFAESLRRHELPASPAPFQLAEVPRGLTLSFAVAQDLCLVPPPVTRAAMQQGLCVSVDSPQTEQFVWGPETVAGRPAAFTDSDLLVDLGHGRVLTVSADPDVIEMTPAEMIRFAGGVRVAGT